MPSRRSPILKRNARTLNQLARKIASARGQITKHRKAIHKTPVTTRAGAKAIARATRSAAAKKGWITRRARLLQLVIPSGKFMPMLTRNGIVWINPLGDDRSLLGSYWNAVSDWLDNRITLTIDLFDGLSVLDSESGQTLPFITDKDIILAYREHFDFGPSFYKARGEAPSFKP
jgi:hypothetical protein